MPLPPSRRCSIPECSKKRAVRGWCQHHYDKWRGYGDPLYVYVRPSPAERFWARVNKNGPIHPVCGQCWTWTGALTAGYGIIGIKDRGNVPAHTFSWEIHNGRINVLCTLHHCDNTSCVNPAHLFSGTRKDNNLDKVKKGRQPRGEACGGHKLTEKQVQEIISNHTPRSKVCGTAAYARRFKVCEFTVRQILNGKKWKHVARPHRHS